MKTRRPKLERTRPDPLGSIVSLTAQRYATRCDAEGGRENPISTPSGRELDIHFKAEGFTVGTSPKTEEFR